MTGAGWALALSLTACAGLLAWAVRDFYRAGRPPLPPLPQRTRTAPGLPADGAPPTWRETLIWNELLHEYGPEPAWDDEQRRAAG